MIRVEWKLRRFLRTHDISVQEVARAMGGKRQATLYRLTSLTDPPTRVDLHTLEAVIAVLRQKTGENVQVSDIFEVVELPPEEEDDMRLWDDAEMHPPLDPDAHGQLAPSELGEPLRFEPGIGWVTRGDG